MCKEKVTPMSSPTAMTAVALLLLLLVRLVTPALPQQGSYHPQYGTYIGRLNAYVEGISGRVRGEHDSVSVMVVHACMTHPDTYST